MVNALVEVGISPDFTTLKACAISLGLLIVPLPSRIPALRQHILGITPGLSFSGHPTRWGIRLVTYSVKAESRQRVIPFRRLMGSWP